MANTAVSKVPVAITFHKSGTQPPVFIAGTFSDSLWEPQEMGFTVDEAGEYTYTKTVHLTPGAHIQYKFRIGLGDWWVLNEDAPTAIDDAGNKNNCLAAPDLQQSSYQRSDPDVQGGATSAIKPKGLQSVQDLEKQRHSSTPIEQVANTAAEVAETAKNLDDDTENLGKGKQAAVQHTEAAASNIDDPHDDDDDNQEFEQHEPPPMFAHECLGAYELPPDDDVPHIRRDRQGHHGSVDYEIDKYDLNDPTLERWPSDRTSIFDAVRKVETGRNEDLTNFLGSPISPVIGSRRASFVDEEAILSSGGSSPVLNKKLDVPRKKSHGSIVSHRSLTSLASIVEEEGKDRKEGGDQSRPPPVIQGPGLGINTASAPFKTPTSDEDEGVVLLQSSKSKSDKRLKPVLDQDQTGTSAKTGSDADIAEVSPRLRSPGIHIQPPDEMAELEDADEVDSTHGLVSPQERGTEPTEQDPTPSQLRRRHVPSDRPITPQSFHNVRGAEGGNWIRAFLRVLFVDWIGGFVSRLCGGNRK